MTTSEPVETPAGWTKVDDTHFTKVISSNIPETDIPLVDKAGNTGNTTYEVGNIDKTAPTGNITVSKTTPTNQNVTLTLNTSEAISTPAGWTRVSDTRFTKSIPTNTSENVTFTDPAGNRGSANISVTNIDKVAPTGNITYSETNPTNGDVTATLTTSEAVNNIPGWTKVDDTHFTKVVSENTTATVAFVDPAGNTGQVTMSVQNIDKVAPTGTVSYSETNPTNGDVTVTLNTSEAVETPEGWTRVLDTEFTKTVSANETGTVSFSDPAGNN